MNMGLIPKRKEKIQLHAISKAQTNSLMIFILPRFADFEGITYFFLIFEEKTSILKEI